MSKTPIWERLETDTDKSFEAFGIYRDMGSGRSLDKAWKQYQNSTKTVSGYFRQWSTDHNWQERIEAWDTYQDGLRQERNLERQKLIEDNAYGDYEMLRDAIDKFKQDYVLVKFTSVKPSDISNLIHMMKQADDYARRAVGLSDRITESKNEHKVEVSTIIIKTGMDIDDL